MKDIPITRQEFFESVGKVLAEYKEPDLIDRLFNHNRCLWWAGYYDFCIRLKNRLNNGQLSLNYYELQTQLMKDEILPTSSMEANLPFYCGKSHAFWDFILLLQSICLKKKINP